MNTICLLGHLTADPELRNTQGGVAVTSFKLAVDRDYTPKGQEKQADFIPVVAWRQTAEFVCKYFGKGQRAALTGSLQTRQYTDRDGNNRTAYEVVAEHVYFAESKKDSGAPAPTVDYSDRMPKSAEPADDFEVIPDEDSLPF